MEPETTQTSHVKGKKATSVQLEISYFILNILNTYKNISVLMAEIFFLLFNYS